MRSKVKLKVYSLGILILVLFPATFLSQDPDENIRDWIKPINLCWNYPTEELTGKTLASDNKNVIVPLSGKIVSINMESGKLNWKTDYSGVLESIFFVEGNVILLNTEVGKKVRFTEINGRNGVPYVGNSVLEQLDSKYINVHHLRNILMQRDIQNENFLRFLDKNSLSHLFKLNRNIYFVVNDENELFSLDLQKRLLKKHLEFRHRISKIKYDTNYRRLIVSDKIGNIFFIEGLNNFDLKTSKVYQAGGEITQIQLTDDDLLYSSKDNYLYSIKLKNKKLNWKTKFTGRLMNFSANKRIVYVLSHGSQSGYLLDIRKGNFINKIDFAPDLEFIGNSFLFDKYIYIPTDKGLYAYSWMCK